MRENLQFIYSLFYILLLILGIAGITQSIVQEGGLLEMIAVKVGWFIDYGLLHPFTLIPIALGAGLIAHLWFSGTINPAKKVGIWGSTLNFLLIAIGAYYAVGMLRQYLF